MVSKPPHNSTSERPLLVDSHGRRLNYLRLSVTDLCNLRCTYCMPKNGVEKLERSQVLTLEEIARVAGVVVGFGVDKIRITGGEPLLRHNLEHLLHRLNRLSPRPDLRLTTNGVRLADNLEMLANSRISVLNVSLDTLMPKRFGAITGRSQGEGEKLFARVWQGIVDALNIPSLTVKLNVVPLKGLNEGELLDFARLTLRLPLSVRFIEYMPTGRGTAFMPHRFISNDDILRTLHSLGPLEELPFKEGDGPARRLRLEGAKGELGMISAMSSHFCESCNRLRLSADGKLVPCLMNDAVVDLRDLLRRGASNGELAGALLAATEMKPRWHGQETGMIKAKGRPMSRLGG